MSTSKTSAAAFRVGDWVRLEYGPEQLLARIIEDRGNLGVNHRRLYRIQLLRDREDQNAFEVPESALEPANECKNAMAVYLRAGGLVSILKSNAGGTRPSIVWISCTDDGNVSHSFAPGRGALGGEAPPSWATQADRIFTPRKREVVDFVMTFGFTRREAEQIVGSVGQTP